MMGVMSCIIVSDIDDATICMCIKLCEFQWQLLQRWFANMHNNYIARCAKCSVYVTVKKQQLWEFSKLIAYMVVQFPLCNRTTSEMGHSGGGSCRGVTAGWERIASWASTRCSGDIHSLKYL